MTCPEITLVLPYYNEAGFIERTLASLVAQTCRDFVLVLVDNASSDNSADICRAVTASWQGPQVLLASESAPGKVQALRHGIALVETPFIATIDADTVYPPDYVETVVRLFKANPGAAMVMAADIYGPENSPAMRLRRWGIWLLSRLFRAKCHTGAYAQAFRTEALRQAGGFDLALWPYVLEDHEIVHRVGRFGHQVYSPAHFCHACDRRGNHAAVSWTGWESLLYVLLPEPFMDWFFYRFLADRFRARSLGIAKLRERDWTDQSSN